MCETKYWIIDQKGEEQTNERDGERESKRVEQSCAVITRENVIVLHNDPTELN